MTEWPEFRELDWAEVRGAMRRPLIVDGRNFLDRDELRRAGFTYEGIGRYAARADARRSSWRAARARACARSPSPSPSR